jgi:hypothetical protein
VPRLAALARQKAVWRVSTSLRERASVLPCDRGAFHHNLDQQPEQSTAISVFPHVFAGSGVVSLLMMTVLAWLGLALVVIVAGLVLSSNKAPPRYLTLNVLAEEPFAEEMDEDEREAA